MSISKNFFTKNRADLAASINAAHIRGMIYISDNIFIENFAVTQTYVLIGAAAACLIQGSTKTMVSSHSNLYIYNILEFGGIRVFFSLLRSLGVIVNYYGNFSDENSHYIGFFYNFSRFF